MLSADDIGETDAEAEEEVTQEVTEEATEEEPAADAEDPESEDADPENDIQELAASDEPTEESEDDETEDEDLDEELMLLDGDVVAEVTVDNEDSEQFTSLGDAIDAANSAEGDNVTVTLLADVTETVAESSHFTISRGMTLDLNENTIYVAGTDSSQRLFYIDDLDQVTIKFTNGTIDGTAEGSDPTPCYFIYDYRGSKKQHDLVLEGLTVQNFGACIFGTVYQQSSNFTATNCVFQNNDTRAFCIQNYASMSSYRDYSDVVVTGCTIDNNNYETTRTGTETVTPNNTTGYAGYAAMGGGFFINWANSVTITGNIVKNNSAQLNGGGFMVCGSYNTDIEDNTVTGNKTTLDTVPWMASINNYNPYTAGGGGFTVYRPQKDVNIKGNTVTDNSTYGFGGGFFVTHNNYDSHVLDDIYIKDNIVSNNLVEPFDWNNTAHGGGIAVYNVNGVHEEDNSVIQFSDNTVTQNRAGDDDTAGSTANRGGGISVVDGDSTTEIIIDSGTISGNIADIGGGIDLTLPYNEADRDAVGGSSVLKLYNVAVTGNNAVRGGGLWTNPSSKTEMYAENSNGGVIYGNTASGSFTYEDGSTYEASGDDICYEGADSDLEVDGELTGTDADVKSDSKLGIINYDLGNSTYDWYTDEMDARYKDASDPSGLLVSSSEYTFRDTVNLHADLDSAGATPELNITGNTARAYGGGIASDDTLYFGDNEEKHEAEVDVIVTDSSGTTISDSIYDTLAEAVNAANEVTDTDLDVTLRLNKDIIINLDLSEEDKDAYATVTRGITLDLNKNTIDVKGGDTEKRMLNIETADEIIITNGTINGSPTGAVTTDGYILYSEGSSGDLHSLVIENVDIIDFGESVYGTIYTKYCDLTMTDCNVKNNDTRGFFFVGGTGGTHEAALSVEGCTFDTNTATEGSTSINAFGGAFYAEYAASTIVMNSTFNKNGDHGRSEDFMYLEGGGAFYLNNCGTSSEVAPLTTSDDDNIAIINNTITENTALSKIFEHTVENAEFWKTGGGGFNLYNTAGEVKIKNNSIDGNRAFSWGGGIAMLNEDYINNGHLGNVDVYDNEITNNILYDTMYIYDPNDEKKTVSHRCEGGGIAVIDMESTHGDESVSIDFIGNKVNSNTCGTKHTGTSDAESKFNRGGGMSLYGADENGVAFNLISGEVCDNVADASGGINFTEKNAYNVRLYNGIITENTAFRGGGVWLCPTSETTFFETFGGAIYNNTAETNTRIEGGYWFPANTPSCGDDIRYEGNDSDIIEYLWNDQQEYNDWVNSGSQTICSVSSRALGGYQYDWYTDGMYALNLSTGRNPYSGSELFRYKDADDKSELYIPLETVLKTATVAADGRNDGYKQRTGSFSLHAELSDEAIAHAEEEATFLISGNTAYFVGGGIGSNCQFYFGYEADESLVVEKSFVDENGDPIGEEDENGDPTRVDELPEYIKVELVREAFDEDGNSVMYEELETIELNAENNWRYAFEDLEHYLLLVGDDEDPDAVHYYDWVYSVKEVEVGESKLPDSDEDFYWNPTYEIEEDKTSGIFTVKMTNYRRLAPKVTKEEYEDDYERKDEDIEHDDENGHFEENIEGDGWGTWDDADNNQEIRYHIKVEHIKDTYKMTIHDYLEEGLDFEPGTVSVRMYNNAEDTEGYLLEEGTDADYVINEGECSDPDCPMVGCTFEIRFADYLFDPEDDPDNPGQDPIDDDAWLLIEYNALTDTHAGDYFEGDHEYEDIILNDAYLDCIIATTGLSFRSMPVETETDLYGFGVYKYYEDESGNRQPLSGAQFILSETGMMEDGSIGTRYATFTQETDNGKIYYLTSGWVDEKEDAGILTSGADGYIRIEGLDDDTYVLTEVQAPAGYKTLEDPITVVLGEDDTVTVDGNDSATKEEGVLHEFSVGNEEATTDISGSKTWNDENDQNGARPESITIHLMAGDTEIDSVTVTAADDWSWSFTGLPTHENGKEIVYNVVETIVEDYTTTENGYDVTNAYTPGKTGINARKIWDDNDDQNGKRPESIKVELIKNGEATGQTITLDESNDWYGSFTDLDEYTDEIKNEYSVEEVDASAGYESRIGHLEDTPTFIITNSYTADTTEISGSKIWEDEEDKNGDRPDSIFVNLRNGEDIVQTVCVTEEDGWDWTFTGLPKYENGKEIEYTVTEEKVANYKAEITGDQDSGFEITNTYTPEEVAKKPEGGTKSTPTTAGGNTPKTSDTNHLGIWLLLMLACAVIVGDVYYIKRRRTK